MRGKFSVPVRITWLSLVAASGAAALIYQVTWQRWLALTTGSSTGSMAIVVAAFLAGISLGAYAGGTLADRLPARLGWLVFAALEIATAAFALASPTVLYDLLPMASGLGPDALLRTMAVLLVVLLPPTMLMGMTMPILSTSVRMVTPTAQAGFISRLTFANTIGAALGALAVPLLLAPMVGFDGAVRIGAALNIAAAVVAVLVWGWLRTVPLSVAPARGGTPPALDLPAGWWLFWSAHFVTAGFVGLVYEIVAFRIVEVIAKARSFTFGLMLCLFLAGYAFGALVGDWARPRLHHARWTAFFAGQAVLYVLVALLPLLVWTIAMRAPFAASWAESLADYRYSTDIGVLAINYLAVPAVLLTMPAMVMGFSFAVTQQLIQTDFASVGRRLGWLQAAGTLGSVAGAWFVVQVAFPVFGTAATLRGICVVGGLGYAAVWAWNRRAMAAGVAAVVTVAIAVALPSQDRFWQGLGGARDPSRLMIREGATAVSAIRFQPDATPPYATVVANGKGQSHLPRAEATVHVALGAIPAFVHPAPRRIGIIGLGSGTTAWAAGARQGVESLVIWELLSSQAPLLMDYADRTGDRTVDWFLREPTVHLRRLDGRKALQDTDERFDVIEADALMPAAAFAGYLYSIEFFELLRNRLAPGGIAATWVPTDRVLQTFLGAFPHVVVLDGLVALGSESEIEIDWAVVKTRLQEPGARAHFATAGVDAVSVVERHLAAGPDVLPTIGGAINTDLWPRDELPPLDAWLARLRRQRPPS
jgi:hypothetical protein